jgi:hypothetical protein
VIRGHRGAGRVVGDSRAQKRAGSAGAEVVVVLLRLHFIRVVGPDGFGDLIVREGGRLARQKAHVLPSLGDRLQERTVSVVIGDGVLDRSHLHRRAGVGRNIGGGGSIGVNRLKIGVAHQIISGDRGCFRYPV